MVPFATCTIACLIHSFFLFLGSYPGNNENLEVVLENKKFDRRLSSFSEQKTMWWLKVDLPFYLQYLRRTKASHPHKAPFGRCLIHPRKKMKHIGFYSYTFQLENLIEMRHEAFQKDLKVLFTQICLQSYSKITHLTLILVQPMRIFQIERGNTYSTYDCT